MASDPKWKKDRGGYSYQTNRTVGRINIFGNTHLEALILSPIGIMESKRFGRGEVANAKRWVGQQSVLLKQV